MALLEPADDCFFAQKQPCAAWEVKAAIAASRLSWRAKWAVTALNTLPNHSAAPNDSVTFVAGTEDFGADSILRVSAALRAA